MTSAASTSKATKRDTKVMASDYDDERSKTTMMRGAVDSCVGGLQE